MSLIEENGAFGLLGIMSYFNRLPRSARPRTLALYFDCRHFMPGGEGSWEEYDYYQMHPERAEVDRRDDRRRAHGRPPDDRSRARRQPVRLLQRASGRWRRHHEPDGRLQQQHLARRSDCASGDRQPLAARGRQGRQRGGPGVNGGYPGLGEEPDEQGTEPQDARHRAGRRLARRLDADLRAGGHRSRPARLRQGLLRAAGGRA